MPGSEVMRLCGVIDSLPDTIYTHVDPDTDSELCRDFERIMDDFRDITRPFVRTVYVDKDCNIIRRASE